MRQELRHFTIDGAYGWNQDWFPGFFMRLGGCAAVTACDSCVYFALRRGLRNLIPFDPGQITRRNYLTLSERMKPYLHPRMRGIDRLEIYQDGFGAYLRDIGASGWRVGALHGDAPFADAADALREQIRSGYPVPFLLLMHDNPAFDFYEWHWFLLMGYDERPDSLFAQAVTYGASRWLDFRKLWHTGRAEKGGMILFDPPA
ncbi:MAG: hypothetical protein IJK52_04660 [Oscillospiraceae bacterium]|nr:hypothetical protein [Oscillospiraceae bacterium]